MEGQQGKRTQNQILMGQKLEPKHKEHEGGGRSEARACPADPARGMETR
jgi:hypothetical protein